MSPVGGLSHQGKIDPEQVEKPKASRDPKRRTVQVEYVAPQSQTVRGEVSPKPVQQPTLGSPIALPSSDRNRSGSQGPPDSRKASAASTRKPLPQDPPVSQDTRRLQESQATSSRTAQRPVTSQPGIQPPARPARDPPRSASESLNALGQLPSSSNTRPTTGGSMTSTGAGRLPSRGNSYSQPLAPVVAVTNAHGSLAQSKNGRQYNISAPIPQQEPYYPETLASRANAQRVTSRYSQAPQPREEPKGHKRSNTLGSVWGRSASFFGGGKSQVQDPGSQPEKKYPPTSMRTPIVSDSPRQSTDSRRPSFSFGRKNSDPSRIEKPRRFSILPASFSFKGLGGGPKEYGYESARPISQQKQPASQERDARSAPYGERSPSDSGMSVPLYDGTYDRNRNVSAPASRQQDLPIRSARKPGTPSDARYTSQPVVIQNGPLPPGHSYYINESVAPTNSDASIGQYQSRYQPQYPQGFNSYDDEPRKSSQQNRLQKPNKRFEDAYEQGQGQHAGSSGAARKVMDFFRRRGKARAGDER
jgi:protein-serine/threonine kinase